MVVRVVTAADLVAELGADTELAGALFTGPPAQTADTDERYTPAWVFDGLGLMFDTDPASPVGGGDCVPARVKYTADDDGLSQPWHGLVWLNPPYSNTTPWARRLIAHGNGLLLGPFANAAWLMEAIEAADLIWLPRDFPFTHPTHAGRRSNMPLMFAAYGDTAAAGLARLARSGRHRGVLVGHV